MADFLLLSRPDCHLCEEFFDELLDAFPEVAARTARAPVDDQPEWLRRFGHRIPVLLDHRGELICAERFDASAIGQALSDEARKG
jgi:hypothetical protein